MADVKVIRVQFDVDDAELRKVQAEVTALKKGFQDTEKEAKDAGAAMSNAGKQGAQAMSKGASAAEEFAGQLGGMPSLLGQIKGAAGSVGVAIAGAFAVKAIAGFVTEGVKLAGVMEQNRIAFTTFLGSAELADKVLNDIAKFGAETPFEFPELVDSAKKLIAFGVRTEDLMETMRRLGDISAGTGKPIEELSMIYGKVLSKGKASMEELNQLTEAGVPIMQELGRVTGVSGTELFKLVEAGKVGFPQVQQAITNLTNEGGKFAGLTKAQSESMNGLLSTLKDNWNELLRDLGEKLLPTMKELTVSAMTFIQELRSVGIGMAEIFGPVGDALSGINTQLGSVQTSVSAYLDRLTGVKGGTDVVIEAQTGLFDSISKGWAGALKPAYEYFKLVGRAAEAKEARENQERLNIALTEMQRVFKLSDVEGNKFLATIKDYDPAGKSVKAIMTDLANLYKGMAVSADASSKSVGKSGNTLNALSEKLKGIREQIGNAEIGSPIFNQLRKEEAAVEAQINSYSKLSKQTEQLAQGSLAFLNAELSNVKKTIQETPADSGLIPGLVKQATTLENKIDFIEERMKALAGGPAAIEAMEIPVIATMQDGNDPTRQIQADLDKAALNKPVVIDIKPEISDEDKAALMDAAMSITQTTANAVFDIWQANNARRAEAENEALEASYQKELDMAGQNNAAKARAEQKYLKQKEALEKEQREREKNASVAQAIINGALAVTSILAQYPKFDGGIAMTAAIAAAIATTAAQIAVIEAQGFAKGGIDINGPGTETSDSIPARLSKGESVLTAQETKMWKPMLKALRRGDLIPGPGGLPVLKSGAMMDGMVAISATLDDGRIVRELKAQNTYLRQVLADNHKSTARPGSSFSTDYRYG